MSTCTSRAASFGNRRTAHPFAAAPTARACCRRTVWRPTATEGFLLVEVVVALALGCLLLSAGVGLWTGSVRMENRGADQAIGALQFEVAGARFVADLRPASTAGVPGADNSPVLEATPHRVVVLTHNPFDGARIVLCWEISGARLMRRWSYWTGSWFPGAAFDDSKSMLDSLGPASEFHYIDPAGRAIPPDAASLSAIRRVGLALQGSAALGADRHPIVWAEVGQ